MLVLHIVAYMIIQMGELKNQELPNDLKLIEIGNFRPFILPYIVSKCKNRILRSKIHKNRWEKLFMTSFRSCFSPGSYVAISHLKGLVLSTLHRG